jgi:hypothetical protein
MVPLRIQVFTPVEQRLSKDNDRERSLIVQEQAIASWNAEIERRFDEALRARPIGEVPLRGSRP